MKKFNRYIYIGDIHWSQYFREFIQKYDDWNTFFYSAWDLFDRWRFSYQNFLVIEQLFNEGKFNMALWNHDLFYIFSKWLEFDWEMKRKAFKEKESNKIEYLKIKNYYNKLYYYNWWYDTDYSFELDNNWEYNFQEEKQENKEVETKMSHVANFLWKNFNIYVIDQNNNLIIHWWIPILPSGDIVEVMIDNKMISWIELLKKVNDWFKKLDPKSIGILDNYDIDKDMYHNVLKNMERFSKNLKTKDIYNYYWWRHLSPTWFDSSMYDKSEIIRNTLISELNNKGINNIILWHWHNREVNRENFNNKNSKYWENNRIIRIDRSFVENNYRYWNLWYIILDNDNKIIEVWDFHWNKIN